LESVVQEVMTSAPRQKRRTNFIGRIESDGVCAVNASLSRRSMTAEPGLLHSEATAVADRRYRKSVEKPIAQFTAQLEISTPSGAMDWGLTNPARAGMQQR